MHVIYICSEYPPFSHGGIGVKYQRIARQLVKNGWQVGVVGVYPVEKIVQEDDQGVKIYRLPFVKKKGPVALINAVRINYCLRQIHKNRPIDIIESQEAGLAFLLRLTHAKKIIRMSGGHTFFSITLGKKTRFWRYLLDRISFSKADAFCAVSAYVAETTRKLLRLGDREITILPNPVDTGFFKPMPKIMQDLDSILFVGTLTEKKGIRQLIQAMPMICAEVPNACLSVIGRDTFDKETGVSFKQTLTQLVPEKFSKQVKFIGAIPNEVIRDWIAKSQVCVYPSHMEAQGIVVIEAMSCGKAVVASKLGPGPELIEDGVHGFLCDPYDPKDIAAKVISLLKDSDLRERMGQAARGRVEAEFSINSLIERNINFYNSVMHAKLKGKKF